MYKPRCRPCLVGQVPDAVEELKKWVGQCLANLEAEELRAVVAHQVELAHQVVRRHRYLEIAHQQHIRAPIFGLGAEGMDSQLEHRRGIGVTPCRLAEEVKQSRAVPTDIERPRLNGKRYQQEVSVLLERQLQELDYQAMRYLRWHPLHGGRRVKANHHGTLLSGSMQPQLMRRVHNLTLVTEGLQPAGSELIGKEAIQLGISHLRQFEWQESREVVAHTNTLDVAGRAMFHPLLTTRA